MIRQQDSLFYYAELLPQLENLLTQLIDIFTSAIMRIDASIYSVPQKNAWVGHHDVQFWQSRFDKTNPLILVDDNKQALGFIEYYLIDDKDNKNKLGYIDCFYVHPDYQQQKVGQRLYDQAMQQLSKQGATLVEVDASHIAKPFFIKQGFHVRLQKVVKKQGESLQNWRLQYHL